MKHYTPKHLKSVRLQGEKPKEPCLEGTWKRRENHTPNPPAAAQHPSLSPARDPLPASPAPAMLKKVREPSGLPRQNEPRSGGSPIEGPEAGRKPAARIPAARLPALLAGSGCASQPQSEPCATRTASGRRWPRPRRSEAAQLGTKPRPGDVLR